MHITGSRMNQNLFGKSLADVAIERLRTFEPEEGYYWVNVYFSLSNSYKQLSEHWSLKYELL
jgi:hypothetical protein